MDSERKEKIINVLFSLLVLAALMFAAVIWVRADTAENAVILQLETEPDPTVFPEEPEEETVREPTERDLFLGKVRETDWVRESVNVLLERTEKTAEAAKITFETVTPDYFADALIIGDSRTGGLGYHGGLTQAAFFAKTSMSVRNYSYESVYVDGYGNITLAKLLQKGTFGKIYVMFGANDCPFSKKSITEGYNELYTLLRTSQPDAIIYLCAPLHVTKWKSESGSECNNEKLNWIADLFREMAEENSNCYFLNVNEHFDDTDGNLPTNRTGDGVHPYAECYQEWADWLCRHAVVTE